MDVLFRRSPGCAGLAFALALDCGAVVAQSPVPVLKALDIRITTTANRIQILRPGIGIEPETLATGLFAQRTNDPVILSLQVFAVPLFSVLQGASSWIVAKDANTMTASEVADAQARTTPLQDALAAPLAEPPPTNLATNQQAGDPPAKNETGG